MTPRVVDLIHFSRTENDDIEEGTMKNSRRQVKPRPEGMHDDLIDTARFDEYRRKVRRYF